MDKNEREARVMDLQTRIRLANVERARQERERREAEMAQLYSRGYQLGIKAEYGRSYMWDAAQVILGLAGALAILGYVIQSVLS